MCIRDRRTCGTTLGRGTRPALSLFWKRRRLAGEMPHPRRRGAPFVCGPTAHRRADFRTLHGVNHTLSTRAGAHAYVVVYGLRWPRGTYAISARSRLGLESREIAPRSRCVLREAHTYINVPKAVATYLSVRGPALGDVTCAGNRTGPLVGSQTAPGRAPTLCGVGRGPGVGRRKL